MHAWTYHLQNLIKALYLSKRQAASKAFSNTKPSYSNLSQGGFKLAYRISLEWNARSRPDCINISSSRLSFVGHVCINIYISSPYRFSLLYSVAIYKI